MNESYDIIDDLINPVAKTINERESILKKYKKYVSCGFIGSSIAHIVLEECGFKDPVKRQNIIEQIGCGDRGIKFKGNYRNLFLLKLFIFIL